ncbi:N-acetyltransferase [Rhizobium deserti]|uniref:N-acetyltransferase n=1 Tax=Rhizobium deserti TaxID=2547961 RepID=A0A4R5UKP5_9HYPH|nr:GNAT family N-acetyltransferase [Rhizobium deserti]TDK37491.1 N-acetyltransferase [Rhizobium deserti]
MIKIEAFDPQYIGALFSISLATGHIGGDASHLYENSELMGLIYSAPYAALEPSLVQLALDETGPLGFVLGAVDTDAWENRLETEWWPLLRSVYADPGPVPQPEWTLDQRRVHMIHHPTPVPAEIKDRYPAHIHLNLMPHAQGVGIGSRLLDGWLEVIAAASPEGVHVGVNRQNSRALRFWAQQGFTELAPPLAQSARTVWMGRLLR